MKDEYLNKWLMFSQLLSTLDTQLETQLKTEHALTLKEFYVLYFIAGQEQKKMRLQQLQEKVSLSQSALSRLIVRMESRNCGVINRYNCLEDRRGIYIGITETGEQLLKKSEETVEKVLKEALEKNDLFPL